MKISLGANIFLISLTNSVVNAFTPFPNKSQHRLLRNDVSFARALTTDSFLQEKLDVSCQSTSSQLFSSTSSAANNEIDLLEEVDAIFDSIDTNNDNVISADELRDHLVNQMGYTNEYTKYIFSSLDTDSNGELTREEMKFAFYNFEALAMYMTLGVGGSDVTSDGPYSDSFRKLCQQQRFSDKLVLNDLADLIFDKIDTDESGEISKEELHEHFEAVTERCTQGVKSTDDQAKEYVATMFATLDMDNNGFIERQEMRDAFQKYDFKLLAKTFGLRVYRTAEV